jgi:hypothetical protein
MFHEATSVKRGGRFWNTKVKLASFTPNDGNQISDESCKFLVIPVPGDYA